MSSHRYSSCHPTIFPHSITPFISISLHCISSDHHIASANVKTPVSPNTLTPYLLMSKHLYLLHTVKHTPHPLSTESARCHSSPHAATNCGPVPHCPSSPLCAAGGWMPKGSSHYCSGGGRSMPPFVPPSVSAPSNVSKVTQKSQVSLQLFLPPSCRVTPQ
jgi:hypothetical protein